MNHVDDLLHGVVHVRYGGAFRQGEWNFLRKYSNSILSVLPRNYSLTTHDKQKIISLNNNDSPYCQLQFSSSKQPQSHVISTYSGYATKAVATITNFVLCKIQLMIRMEGTRGGGK